MTACVRPLAFPLMIQELIPARDTINTEFLDLVQKLLAFDSQQRMTVREALRHPFFQLSIPMEDF